MSTEEDNSMRDDTTNVSLDVQKQNLMAIRAEQKKRKLQESQQQSLQQQIPPLMSQTYGVPTMEQLQAQRQSNSIQMAGILAQQAAKRHIPVDLSTDFFNASIKKRKVNDHVFINKFDQVTQQPRDPQVLQLELMKMTDEQKYFKKDYTGTQYWRPEYQKIKSELNYANRILPLVKVNTITELLPNFSKQNFIPATFLILASGWMETWIKVGAEFFIDKNDVPYIKPQGNKLRIIGSGTQGGKNPLSGLKQDLVVYVIGLLNKLASAGRRVTKVTDNPLTSSYGGYVTLNTIKQGVNEKTAHMKKFKRWQKQYVTKNGAPSENIEQLLTWSKSEIQQKLQSATEKAQTRLTNLMVGSLFPTGNLAAYSKEAFESFGKDGVNSRANQVKTAFSNFIPNKDQLPEYLAAEKASRQKSLVQKAFDLQRKLEKQRQMQDLLTENAQLRQQIGK